MNRSATERPLWVARTVLAGLIASAVDNNPELSQRELAARAQIDPKMLRKILSGQAGDWTRLETAERLLAAAGLAEQLIDMDVVCAA
jgi:N-acetyl-anhydromuramyl-L-alanine amidase AmpD